MSSSLAVVGNHAPVVFDDFDDRRVELIRKQYANNAPQLEFELFLAVCRRTGLSPEARQIYFISRGGKWTIQTSIDGYRLIADRSKAYAGSDDPIFEESGQLTGPRGKVRPDKATVTVWKIVQGIRCPFTSSARWDEYVATDREGRPTGQWLPMPYLMLAKCFSEDTEVLTDRGFQRFQNVTGRIMQVTDRGLEPTDAQPFAQPWTGSMVTLESDDLNFSVTPNHDMVTTEGKMEAGALFARARTRPNTWVPRCISGTGDDAPITDQDIQITAAYLADGTDRAGQSFQVEVSRDRKVQLLREIRGYSNEYVRKTAGDVGQSAIRTIVTKRDKQRFVYDHESVSWLCERGKRIRGDHLLMLSRRQARLFVDTLLAFDGSTSKATGVRRFYTSRPDHIEAFEVACVVAGYSVSPRRERVSDISQRPNFNVTVSGRSEIPVIRWGRDYHNLSTANQRRRTGLTITTNASGRVWCVTVPSGVIVVRRHGFSMLCGNCAESLALRKAFPAELSAVYTDSEMDQPGGGDYIEADAVTVRDAPPAPARPATQSAQPRPVESAPAPSQSATGPSVQQNTNPDASTKKQRDMILAICDKLGIDDDARHAMQLEMTGHASLTTMSRQDASKVIDYLVRTSPAPPAPGSPDDLAAIEHITSTPSTAPAPDAEHRQQIEGELDNWTAFWRYAREQGFKTKSAIEDYLGHSVNNMNAAQVRAELDSRQAEAK